MLKGRLKSLKSIKGYGFIIVDNKDQYFFHRDDYQGHWNDMADDFDSGTQVEFHFEPDRTEKGLRARNVCRTDWPNQVDGGV